MISISTVGPYDIYIHSGTTVISLSTVGLPICFYPVGLNMISISTVGLLCFNIHNGTTIISLSAVGLPSLLGIWWRDARGNLWGLPVVQGGWYGRRLLYPQLREGWIIVGCACMWLYERERSRESERQNSAKNNEETSIVQNYPSS